MQYDTGSRCVFYNRYHIVRSRKYRHKGLTGNKRFCWFAARSWTKQIALPLL